MACPSSIICLLFSSFFSCMLSYKQCCVHNFLGNNWQSRRNIGSFWAAPLSGITLNPVCFFPCGLRSFMLFLVIRPNFELSFFYYELLPSRNVISTLLTSGWNTFSTLSYRPQGLQLPRGSGAEVCLLISLLLNGMRRLHMVMSASGLIK